VEEPSRRAVPMVRLVDKLGRLVIPATLRRVYELEPGALAEVMALPEGVLLRQHRPGCVFCGSQDIAVDFQDRHVCQECLAAMRGGT